MLWRSLAGISDGGEAQEAVQLAVDGGWLLVECRHSVCLTDAGRLLLEEENPSRAESSPQNELVVGTYGD